MKTFKVTVFSDKVTDTDISFALMQEEHDEIYYAGFTVEEIKEEN